MVAYHVLWCPLTDPAIDAVIHDGRGVSLLEHDAYEIRDAVDYAPEVDPNHPFPVLERTIPGSCACTDAGIVEQQVNATECLDGPVGQPGDTVRVRYVGHHTDDTATVTRRFRRRRFERLLLHLCQHHLHSFRKSPFGKRFADTTSPACDDDGDLAFKRFQ